MEINTSPPVSDVFQNGIAGHSLPFPSLSLAPSLTLVLILVQLGDCGALFSGREGREMKYPKGAACPTPPGPLFIISFLSTTLPCRRPRYYLHFTGKEWKHRKVKKLSKGRSAEPGRSGPNVLSFQTSHLESIAWAFLRQQSVSVSLWGGLISASGMTHLHSGLPWVLGLAVLGVSWPRPLTRSHTSLPEVSLPSPQTPVVLECSSSFLHLAKSQ